MEIRDRIQLLLAKEGLTPSQFADSIDVQRSSISHIINGRNKPSLDYLQKILLQYPDYDANWLVLGKGEPKSEGNEKVSHTPKPQMPEIPFNVDNTKDTHGVTNVNKTIEPTASIKPEPEVEKKIEERATQESIPVISDSKKDVEQVVIFYTDGTFKAYRKG